MLLSGLKYEIDWEVGKLDKHFTHFISTGYSLISDGTGFRTFKYFEEVLIFSYHCGLQILLSLPLLSL